MTDVGSAPSDEEVNAVLSSETHEHISKKIKYVLTHFPAVSSVMMQMGISPNVPPSVWKPILQRMIDDGVVVREELSVQGPSGRYQFVHRLRLATTNRELLDAAVNGASQAA